MSIILKLEKDAELVKKLRKPLDEAVYTIAVLKKTGNANISSLASRVICQKIVYFAGRLGITPQYDFSIYVNGPYSPELANDLYALEPYFGEVKEAEFISEKTEESFKKLQSALGSENKIRELEVAATLDFFRAGSESAEVAVKKTKEKKGATEAEIERAKETLKALGLGW